MSIIQIVTNPILIIGLLIIFTAVLFSVGYEVANRRRKVQFLIILTMCGIGFIINLLGMYGVI